MQEQQGPANSNVSSSHPLTGATYGDYSRYKKCPFLTLARTLATNAAFGDRCTPGCMLYNLEQRDCNINVLAKVLSEHKSNETNNS